MDRRRLDVNCTGVGKVLIAFLPPEELEYLLRTKEFARHNSCTIISKNVLGRELMLVRQSGYALDNEGDEPGVRWIAAPVFDEDGAAVAAISVAGTANQIGMDRVPILSRQVMRAGQGISSRMSYVAQNLGIA